MEQIDIGIIGSSLAGLTLAAMLQEEDLDYSIAIFDKTFNATNADGKSIVLGKTAAHSLKELNVFPTNSRPINNTFIGFGNGKNRSLMPDNEVNEMGYAVNINTIKDNLLKKCDGVQKIDCTVKKIDDINDYCLITTDKDKQYACRFLIIACQLPFEVSEFNYFRYQYKQKVVSLVAEIPTWSASNAMQSYNASGVTVIVPRTDDKVGVICCLSPSTAEHIAQMTDDQFKNYLSQELKQNFSWMGQRHFYTPTLKTAYCLGKRNKVLLGQGATSLHPIGAQSLGLGIGDARVLTQLIAVDKITARAALHYDKIRLKVHRQSVIFTSILALGPHMKFSIFHHLGQTISKPLESNNVRRFLINHLS